MKTLSIRQPWSWLIVNGYKDVENRDWHRKIRGEILIHASKFIDHDGYRFVKESFPEIYPLIPPPDKIERGGIVGKATIVDCVTKWGSLWFRGKYGFVFDVEQSTPLPFMPLSGQLGFFIAAYEAPNG